MLKIGITGQAGFIGTHLFNTLGLYPEKFERVPFEDNFFLDTSKLESFVSNCDIIVHLAAMNRHQDQKVIYETNLQLVNQLITACKSTKAKPHVLFSSSTQEECNNLYGKSKKEGRVLLEQWAKEKHGKVTALIIPNVYGPFGQPYYNSVVATFCHQLTHNEQPKIDVDGDLKLIFVSELLQQIIKIVSESAKANIRQIKIKHTKDVKVSQLLQLLENYKINYFEKGEIPALDTPFHRNLYNTFACYINHESFFPFELKPSNDARGTFAEIIKFNGSGQISFSTTLPGITRGNHFHMRKAERFTVIRGKARIDIRRIGTNKVISFELNGAKPSFVDMPIWYTHNITNIGDEDLYTIFWTNEHFKPDDSDTFFEKV